MDRWIADLRARARIQARVERLRAGNPGDVKPIGAGASEMRIDYGPGYRVYFLKRGDALIILLAGGEKHSQPEDIKTALKLANRLKEDAK
ncbi:MAG TPA: type II toxin-antitoxin system RelE/ParE family toxin [Gallionella sp.]|jgi:putative addiction module killer protein|nr:type II toxin-antitoxin system RelE/ParE family toxin [Gallionella sp.]